MCSRWDAFRRHLTHLDDEEIEQHWHDHQWSCPECANWTPIPLHLSRDPEEGRKEDR